MGYNGASTSYYFGYNPISLNSPSSNGTNYPI